MTQYPLPSYAAHIWIAGDKIWLGFPGEKDGVREHSVPFPATDKGFSLILATIKARQEAPCANWLGTRGAPCRHEIERQLANDKRYNAFIKATAEAKVVSAADAAENAKFLEELGL